MIKHRLSLYSGIACKKRRSKAMAGAGEPPVPDSAINHAAECAAPRTVHSPAECPAPNVEPHAVSVAPNAMHQHYAETLINALSNSFLLLNLQGIIITLNSAAAAILRRTPKDAEGQSLCALMPNARSAARLEKHLQKMFARAVLTNFEFTLHRRDLRVTCHPVCNDERVLSSFALYVEDITEQKEKKRREQEVSLRIFSAQENERKRIRRALHDSTMQTLSGIKLLLEIERDDIKKRYADWNSDSADYLVGLVHQTINDLRRIMRELHPAVLEELGLLAAIRWLAQELYDTHAVSVQMKLSVHESVLSDIQKAIFFRVAQEALYNVAHHARTSGCFLSFVQKSRQCILTVSDNGSGISKKTNEKGLGFANMREQLQLIDGTLEVQSAQGMGCTVIASAPLIKEKKSEEENKKKQKEKKEEKKEGGEKGEKREKK